MIKGDHFEVSITSNIAKHLEIAIQLVFAEVDKVTHYKIGPYKRDGYCNEATTLMLGNPYDSTKAAGGWLLLPYPLDAKNAVSFVSGWLDHAQRDDNNYPDVDGTVECNAFTVKSMDRDIVCLVIPTYSIYSK